MGVATSSERAEWWFKESPCQLCMNEIEPGETLVYWHSVAHINLHVRCARSLGEHLIGDAREADLSSGSSQWTGRARGAFKRSLEAQEHRP